LPHDSYMCIEKVSIAEFESVPAGISTVVTNAHYYNALHSALLSVVCYVLSAYCHLLDTPVSICLNAPSSGDFMDDIEPLVVRMNGTASGAPFAHICLPRYPRVDGCAQNLLCPPDIHEFDLS
jgi:hypothetical protein